MVYLLLQALVTRIRKVNPLAVLFVLMVVGAASYDLYRLHRTIVTVQTVAPGVTAVTVNDRTLSTADVARYLPDPKDKALIASLTSQLKALKASTTAVVVSTAHSESTGGGRIITDAPPEATVTLAPDAPESSEPQITAMHYKDYRLKFDADLVQRQAAYTLSQSFETVITTGRRADGSRLALAQLYELNENNERVPVPTTSTVGVFADETAPHWMRKLAVQGGVAATRSAEGVTASGALVAAQWLKHGRTADASEVTYAVLSPALILAPGVTDIGILPVSVNLGRLPHQPFTNLWLSPFVAKSQRVGLVLTATF